MRTEGLGREQSVSKMTFKIVTYFMSEIGTKLILKIMVLETSYQSSYLFIGHSKQSIVT